MLSRPSLALGFSLGRATDLWHSYVENVERCVFRAMMPEAGPPSGANRWDDSHRHSPLSAAESRPVGVNLTLRHSVAVCPLIVIAVGHASCPQGSNPPLRSSTRRQTA